MYEYNIPRDLQNARVSNLVNALGEWNWPLIDSWIPASLHGIS